MRETRGSLPVDDDEAVGRAATICGAFLISPPRRRNRSPYPANLRSMEPARRILAIVLGERARQLRYPTLLLLTALVFLVDLLVPDLVPFVDEVLLGLLTLLLSTIRARGVLP